MSEYDDYSVYDVVPTGYNLLKARPEELDRYGIPPRPDEPRLFEFWEKLVSPPFSSKQPTFRFANMASSPKKALTAPPSKPSRTQTTPSRCGTVEWKWNWSGAIACTLWPKRIVFATAGWVVPNVSAPSAQALFTPKNPDPKSLAWVGLDGDNGSLPKISLPQIGTAHWLGGPSFAWWDWWRKKSSPKPVRQIDDFAIDAGDEILAGLAVQVSNDVLFFIKNQSTGDFRSFLAKRQPLPDIEPLGSSVEWVVERPTRPKSRKLYPLADYDVVDFKYCLAVAADGPEAPERRLMTLADNGRMIKMREAFADPYRTVYVSRAERRRDDDGSIGVRCTFHEPT